jgi:hypothetical protein
VNVTRTCIHGSLPREADDHDPKTISRVRETPFS